MSIYTRIPRIRSKITIGRWGGSSFTKEFNAVCLGKIWRILRLIFVIKSKIKYFSVYSARGHYWGWWGNQLFGLDWHECSGEQYVLLLGVDFNQLFHAVTLTNRKCLDQSTNHNRWQELVLENNR